MTPAERERHGALRLVEDPATELEHLLESVPPDAGSAR